MISVRPETAGKLAPMYAYTLIIICGHDYVERDFQEIAQRVAALAPDIRPVVMGARPRTLPPDHDEFGLSQSKLINVIDSDILERDSCEKPVPTFSHRALDLWSKPVLIVAFRSPFGLAPPRGTVLRSRLVYKTNQYQLFLKAGLATPKTRVFTFGMTLDESEFGEHVILKPLRINSKGLGVHLVRTKRVSALRPQTFKPNHPIHKDAYLVQQFIDTGDYPTHYRVETLLGEALCCRTIFSSIKRPSLAASDGTLLKGIVASNTVKAGANKTAPARDEEVISLALKMDLALPDCPLKGCDILKEAGTGKLYALECNPRGNSWAFSSPDGDNARAAFGGKQAMIDHLGAWDAAARGLIRRTRADAR